MYWVARYNIWPLKVLLWLPCQKNIIFHSIEQVRIVHTLILFLRKVSCISDRFVEVRCKCYTNIAYKWEFNPMIHQTHKILYQGGRSIYLWIVPISKHHNICYIIVKLTKFQVDIILIEIKVYFNFYIFFVFIMTSQSNY